MKIYLDVSATLNAGTLSGIQRTVCEISTTLAEVAEVQLVRWDDVHYALELVNLAAFTSAFRNGFRFTDAVRTGIFLTGKALEPGGVYFDLDSNWHPEFNRSAVYRMVGKRGLKLAVMLYDVVPLLAPYYLPAYTQAWWVMWLAFALKNADLFIVNTRAVEDEFSAICSEVGVQTPRVEVVPLGSEVGLSSESEDGSGVRESLRHIGETRRFILMVGTVEPRKNHAFILESFEESLFQHGLSLVIAGHKGWMNDDLLVRLSEHSQLGDQLFFIEDASDAEIAFLYRNAYFLAFPSALEGFGLPMVEALRWGLPVLAADLPVMREVAGTCGDYFELDRPSSFSTLVLNYMHDDPAYQRVKRLAQGYLPMSWSQSARLFRDVLRKLEQ